ncbi:MAG: NADH:flavin oxidoreductase/NADH oxidase [Clostridia bacterium]|nr:NADH:flavin oxidoreductase/NADH oxidase [Clostridia bacterium]
MTHLFRPFRVRGLELRNRIVMSPMCQYMAAEDGLARDWHLVHYGSRAAYGPGLIVLEATAVEARGRITEHDLGLWSDEQVGPLRRIVDFLHAQGVAAGVQLAHAGRKGRARGERIIGPTAEPFRPGDPVPVAMDARTLAEVVTRFAEAARRALRAGFDWIEIHAAHGYLLHEFLSPLVNRREDAYGGSEEGRLRLAREVVRAVRSEVGSEFPLAVRLSASDYAPGGLDAAATVRIARALHEEGADLFDCSSGGAVPLQPEEYPGYQLEAAMRVRRELSLPVAAVGRVTEPEFAEAIVANGWADLVALGRELLRHPSWPQEAALRLGVLPEPPHPYERAYRAWEHGQRHVGAGQALEAPR